MSDATYGRDDFGQGGLNDQLDADRLVEEVGLDRAEIRWRKDFVGFDDEDAARLEQYAEKFEDEAEQVAEDFYDNVTDYEETVEVMGRSPKNIDQLKRTQSAYLTTLAGGEYGMDYFKDRARIGKIHDILDMPMKHYLGQYGVYYELVLPLVGERLVESLTDRVTEAVAGEVGDGQYPDGGGVRTAGSEADALEPGDAGEASVSRSDVESVVEGEVDDAIADILSILRIINLDTQVVTDTYIHSYSQRLKEEVERNERLMSEVESDVQSPVSDLRTTANDVAESAAEINEATEKQAERIDEVAGEVSNLSATVEEVASTADEVAEASERSETLAEDGKSAADDAAVVMDEIGTAVDDAAADVDRLQENIEDIDEFVDAIDDIAEQTNMLALNASIEAARAGDAGEGFAVVADEIKTLAQESQEYASDIDRMVATIQTEADDTVASLTETADKVDEGVERVQVAMDSLTDIVDSISETADGIREVSSATDDQAVAAEEIASMVDEVVTQTERVTAEIGELAAANEEQVTRVTEVEDSVLKLTNDQSAADGGRPVLETGDDDAAPEADIPASTDAAPEDVSVPEDVPDGIPDFVVEMLTESQLRRVARGELEPSDLL
jgi:methyl-accepting chemotaxis protein